MKVEIIKQNLDDECSYKYKPMSFCCEKLARNPVIELVADRYDVTENYISEPQFCIANYEEWTEWEEEFHRDDYYPIKFCPFCGEKIETEIIREEDVSDEYARLERERDILCKCACVTDSKSKEENLRRKVRELENKLDYYNELRKYNEEVQI